MNTVIDDFCDYLRDNGILNSSRILRFKRLLTDSDQKNIGLLAVLLKKQFEDKENRIEVMMFYQFYRKCIEKSKKSVRRLFVIKSRFNKENLLRCLTKWRGIEPKKGNLEVFSRLYSNREKRERSLSVTRREFREMSDRECTFRPKINKKSISYYYLPPNEAVKCRTFERELKIQRMKKELEHKFMSDCTFCPRINPVKEKRVRSVKQRVLEVPSVASNKLLESFTGRDVKSLRKTERSDKIPSIRPESEMRSEAKSDLKSETKGETKFITFRGLNSSKRESNRKSTEKPVELKILESYQGTVESVQTTGRMELLSSRRLFKAANRMLTTDESLDQYSKFRK